MRVSQDAQRLAQECLDNKRVHGQFLGAVEAISKGKARSQSEALAKLRRVVDVAALALASTETGVSFLAAGRAAEQAYPAAVRDEAARWMLHELRAGSQRGISKPSRSSAATRPTSADFSAAVNAAAAAVVARGRRGEAYGDSAFISAVYDELRPGFGLEQFKAELLEAMRRGEVSLTRADLVEAMDPRVVARSEAAYLSATFHLVRVR